MSNRDSDGNLASEERDTDCAAADLRGLLELITNQVADADRRHSEVLNQMYKRLSCLGDNTRALKSRVPAEYEPAFARIEDGLDQLADRIATTNTQRGSEANAAVSEAALSSSPAAAKADMTAPMPLKSALTSEQSSGLARKEKAARATSAIDPFDVIETTVAGDSSEPWDQASANALTSHYESGNAGYQPAPVANTDNAPPQALQSAAVAFVPIAHSDAPTNTMNPAGLDRAWLDKRFSEIATRIEQSLADHHPEQSFMALGQRFEDFENRFGDVIAEVASRSDVEAIHTIETQINDLAAQFEQAQTQFYRLDSIESQINALGEHMLAGGGDVGASAFTQQPSIDTEQIAAAAADRVAQHLQFMPQFSEASASGEISEVRRLVEDLIQERRLGDDNTTTMLDTLQQAMMRLLDRVDAIELAQHQAPPAAPAYAQQFSPVNSEYQGASMQPENEEKYSDIWSPRFATGSGDAERAAAPESATSKAGVDDEFNGETRGEDATTVPPRRTEKLRQDFIADARRARERQASQSSAAASISIAEVEEPVRIARGATPAEKLNVTLRKPEFTTAPEPDVSNTGKTKRRLLVAGLVGLVALIPAYMFLKPGRAPVRSPVVATSPVKPAQPAANSDFDKATTGSKSPLKPLTPVPTPDNAPAKTGEAMPQNAPDAATSPVAPAVTPKSAAPAPAATAPKDQLGMPTQPGNLYTTPETMIDDLKFEGAKPSRRAPGDDSASVRDLAPTVHPAGMNVKDFGTRANPDMVAALTEQNASAALSRQIGVASTNFKPAALLPSDMPSESVANTAPRVTGAATSALDLPPATVGPLSLRLAAAKGDPSAEFEVGARLAEGKGTQQNFKEAVRWYQRSATQGFAQAQYRLGTLYERGLGIKVDLSRARVWYSRAAEQGNVKAMHNLAVLSAGSASGAPDYATAGKWFSEAAERGLADSQYNLAVLHENGLGIEQDLKAAYKWLAIAARSGDKESVRRRDAIKEKLDATDLATAQELINGWKLNQPDPMANDSRTAGEAWKARQNGDVNG